MNITALARRHCAAEGNKLSIKGYVPENYNVSYQFFAAVSSGKKAPNAKLLRSLNNAHVRLFPSEPVTVEIDGLSFNLGSAPQSPIGNRQSAIGNLPSLS